MRTGSQRPAHRRPRACCTSRNRPPGCRSLTRCRTLPAAGRRSWVCTLRFRTCSVLRRRRSCLRDSRHTPPCPCSHREPSRTRLRAARSCSLCTRSGSPRPLRRKPWEQDNVRNRSLRHSHRIGSRRPRPAARRSLPRRRSSRTCSGRLRHTAARSGRLRTRPCRRTRPVRTHRQRPAVRTFSASTRSTRPAPGRPRAVHPLDRPRHPEQPDPMMTANPLHCTALLRRPSPRRASRHPACSASLLIASLAPSHAMRCSRRSGGGDRSPLQGTGTAAPSATVGQPTSS